MALHNLKITVVDGGKMSGVNWSSGLNDAKDDKKKKPTDSKLYKILNYNETIKSKIKGSVSKTTFFAMQQGVGLAIQTGKQFINYHVSDIGRSTGDSNYQATVNRRIEQVTDVLSIAGGALSGAAMGAGVGPVGAAVGAVIGAAGAGVNMGFKYADRNRAYQHEMFKESNSQAYNISRANYTALTGRIR